MVLVACDRCCADNLDTFQDQIYELVGQEAAGKEKKSVGKVGR